jgi:hypothetical protein
VKGISSTALLMLAWVSGAALAEAQVMGTPNIYNFEEDLLDQPPAGFTFATTGGLARPGRWLVKAQPDAPTPGHVLAHLAQDHGGAGDRLAATTGVFHSDVRVSAKGRTAAGKAAQAWGLLFRYVDETNHYLTSAGQAGVRLYRVKRGKRTQVGSWNGKGQTGAWNELVAEAKGDRLRVYFNGQKVIEARDNTFRAGGKGGLWTQVAAGVETVVYFDDFNVTSM